MIMRKRERACLGVREERVFESMNEFDGVRERERVSERERE